MKRIAALLFFGLALAAQPIPVIFDTDLGNDIDDALALAMLHAAASRGEIRLLAVTVTKDNPWSPRFVSALNTFYGRGDIPIGIVNMGATRDDGKYTRKTLESGAFPWKDSKLDAVDLLRQTLAAQPDGSVVIIQVGFSTNLARLLDAPGGRDLAAKKVKLVSLMAGNFANGPAEYNVKEDVPSARKLAAGWPTPMVWSGFEVGKTILFPARSIQHDFAWTAKHPVVEGYKLYNKFPYDAMTWDLTSVLYALRPDAGYFTLSPAGTVEIDERGITRFAPSASGRHRCLIVDDQQRARIAEAMVWLASEPAHASLK